MRDEMQAKKKKKNKPVFEPFFGLATFFPSSNKLTPPFRPSHFKATPLPGMSVFDIDTSQLPFLPSLCPNTTDESRIETPPNVENIAWWHSQSQ